MFRKVISWGCGSVDGRWGIFGRRRQSVAIDSGMGGLIPKVAMMVEMFFKLDCIVLSTGCATTFIRTGTGGSTIYSFNVD